MFFFHNDGRANRRVVEEGLRHPLRHPDAAVRGGIRRDIALVHGVSAPEKHRERHSGAVVMRAWRFRIFPRIDVGFGDVPEIVDVIAEDGGDVSGVFGQHRVAAGRRPESGFTAGDGRLADEVFALIEIGFLVGQADDDLGRTGNAVAVPVTLRRRGSGRGGGWRGFDFRAAHQEGQGEGGEERSEKGPAAHEDAQSNASGSRFNTKDLPTRPPVTKGKPRQSRAVLLAEKRTS